MRVWHLNCATLCPGFLFLELPRMVCHCLLVELPGGLVLVDTGLGLDDIHQPGRRLPRLFRLGVRPALREAETALRQIEALGFGARDVRHVLLTHMDVDHAGGIADFPEATIHVMREEHRVATTLRDPRTERRYAPAQWAHPATFRLHDRSGGEVWKGLPNVRPIDELGPDLLLVPLGGHSPGHAGVAVRTDRGWILHAGDAYYHRGSVCRPPTTPWMLRIFARETSWNDEERLETLAQLRSLAADPSRDVHVFCAHDPGELDSFRAG